MTGAETRLDIQPLCDKDYEPMTLDGYNFSGPPDIGIAYFELAYQCRRDDCSRCYNIVHGYFTLAEGRRFVDERIKLCPHGVPMYIAEPQKENIPTVWRCGLIDCGCSKSKPATGLPEDTSE